MTNYMEKNVIEYDDYKVKESTLDDFSLGDFIYVVNDVPRYSPDEIVRRAVSRLGETSYNVIYNNCENFASWCLTGEPIPWDK